MPTTAERLTPLSADSFDFDQEQRFDRAFTDREISFMDAIRFLEFVNNEFDLGLAAQDCVQLKTLGELEGFIDASAG